MKELIMVSEQNVNAIYLDNIQGNKANRLVGGVGKKCRGDGGVLISSLDIMRNKETLSKN